MKVDPRGPPEPARPVPGGSEDPENSGGPPLLVRTPKVLKASAVASPLPNRPGLQLDPVF